MDLSSIGPPLVAMLQEEGVEALSVAERAFALVWIADGAIGNGGFHSVCYNSSGDFAEHFPSAFRMIGAGTKASVCEEFLRLASPPTDHAARLQWHDQISEELEAVIDDLDDAYFGSPDSVDDLLWAFAQAHLV